MASHDHLLREFLATNHGNCPRSEFDRFELDGDMCPECGELLCFRLGAQRFRLAWFVACLMLSAFSFVATILLVVPVFMSILMGHLQPTGTIVALLFGVGSTAFGVVLVRRCAVFVAEPIRKQSFAAVMAGSSTFQWSPLS